MKSKLFILILSVFWAHLVSAVETRPKMRRACLNRLDSTLDLLWFKPTDNCNSFTSFSLYGRDDILSTFNFLGSYNNFSLDNISIKLKNLKDWEFYLVYNKACNGVDSVFSDTITIDNTAPFDSQLDSVSVDLTSQKSNLGWSNNPSKDIKGYYIYHVTGNNDTIGDIVNTSFQDIGPRDPSVNAVSYSIAAYDSCRNLSLISLRHSTIHLQAAYDQCQKSISLTWSRYVGWAEQEYQIYMKSGTGNYKLLVGSVNPAISQFTYNFPVFGETYCFYVRAFKSGANISSSSNIVCVNTNTITAAANSYVAKASVQRGIIELTLVTETSTSLQKVNVYKAEGNDPFQLWQSLNHTGGTLELIDNNVNVQTKSYSYYFTTEGPCNLIFDTSQTAKTILLSVSMLSPGNQQINWSLYSDFIKFTQSQELLLSDNENYDKSSTWNVLNALNNSTKFANDNTVFGVNQEKICYAVRALENAPTPSYPRRDTSYSNIQCITADPIVFFPNAIQLNGYNNTFFPKGTFIDTAASSFIIYNRWGQIVFETHNIEKAWDGKENGEFVQSDVYLYRATIVGLNGKVLYFDGTITVLK